MTITATRISSPIPTGEQKTGEPVKLCVDWLSLTLHDTEVAGPIEIDQVMMAASIALGCNVRDWVDLEHGQQGYSRGITGPGGAMIWWDAPGRTDIHVSLPGKACAVAGQDALIHWMRYSLGHGVSVTRCDTVIDDYARVISPEAVLDALRSRAAVTHAKRIIAMTGWHVGSDVLTGVTVYLGAPSSRQRLRVYDKGLESDGQIDCVRWELQSRDEAAHTMVTRLAYEEWGQVIASRLVGFVDFTVWEGQSEIEKRIRVDWFAELVGGVRKASAYVAKAARTLQELVHWMDRSIGPSLAIAVKSWNGDLEPLWDIIKRGQWRWRPKHLAMLHAAA